MKPLFLYLRPFNVDGKVLVRNPEKDSIWRNLIPTSGIGTSSQVNLEELLLQSIGVDGSLIAIGRTSEIIGAGKVIASDKDWQRVFALLAERAAVIFSVPSLNTSTYWELRWLAAQGYWRKVVMILTTFHFSGANSEYAIGPLVNSLRGAGWHLPDDLTESSLIAFDDCGAIAVHIARSAYKKWQVRKLVQRIV